jgi:hypothetical protein
MRKSAVVLLSLCLVFPAVSGDAKGDAEARARAIAPFLDELTIGVAHVDLARVDFKALAEKVSQLGFVGKKELAMSQQLARTWQQDFLKAGAKSLFLISSLGDRPDHFLIVVPRGKDIDTEALSGLLGMLPDFKVKVSEKAVLAGPANVLERVGAQAKAVERKGLAEAFAAAGDAPCQAVLLPPPIFAKAIQETLPQLPRELGGRPIDGLTRGVRWAALGVDLTPKMSLRLVIQSEDARAASERAQLIGKLIPILVREAKQGLGDEGVVKALALLRPKAQGDQLTLTLDDKTLTTVFVPIAKKAQESAKRHISTNNLKQMALAMHAYHDAYKSLPARANHDAEGKPLLSWRVHVLPFLEQEGVYKQFKLDEPWDSEHNKKLIPRIPEIYRSPYKKGEADGKTPYLVPVGKDLLFPGKKGLHLREITDGTSNTIMIVEAGEEREVIWTKPDDLQVNAKDPLAGLGRPGQTGFPAAFADGSVRYIARTIDAKLFYSLLTRNGGEVASPD